MTAVAAGNYHVLALTTSGQVYAFGANGNGQIGDGTTTSRLSPVPVQGLSNVVAVAAGDSHSLAVTSTGQVWSWGRQALGYAVPGTGQTSPRLIPGLAGATGVEAGQRHSIAVTSSGQVFAWGMNDAGQLGDGGNTTSTPPKLVAGLTGMARVSAGSQNSGAVGTDKSIYMWGYNNRGQLGDNSTTLRRLAVRIVGPGGEWPLAAPTITPATGRYSSARTVVMTATAGTTIRYTLDNTDPSGPSLVYTAAFSVAGTTTVRARAFKTGYAPSAETTRTYTINNGDATAPIISANVSPAANAAGWHTGAGAVTVAFVCTDTQSGIVSCGPNQSIAIDTTSISVTGAAVDGTGRRVQTSVVVKRDTQAPTVSRHTPADGAEFAAGTTSITVSGAVADMISGVASVTCNGVAATLVPASQSFTCANVPVVAGANLLRIDARDTAGLLTRVDGTVYVGSGGPAPTSLSISPKRMAMMAGQARLLGARNNRGRVVTDGVWSTSDAAVADVTVTTGGPFLQALTPGTATVTVVAAGLTATATVEVFEAGGTIPAGTDLWSMEEDPVASGGSPKRATVLRARDNVAFAAEEQADLFFVDEGTERIAGELRRPTADRPTRIRAATLDGRELWEHRFVGRKTRQVAPDEFGGVVIVRESGEDTPGGTWYHDSIRKVDGRTGRIAWEFFARHYYAHLGDVAIHPNGTVYVVEIGHNQPSRLVALNGSTGAATSWELPTGTFRHYVNGALNNTGPTVAHAAGPFVLEDGTVTLVSRVTQSSDSYSHWDGNQTWWPAPGGSCTAEVKRFTLAPGAPAPTSAVVSTAAYPSTCSVPFYLEDYRLLPDGQGGLLLGHRYADFVMRLAPNLTLSLGRTLRLDPPVSGTGAYATEYLLGDDAAYAFVSGVTARSGQPAEYWTKAVGFQPDTLAWFSEHNVSALDTAPRHLRLQATVEGSGVLVSGPEWNNLAQVSEGLWAGWGAAPALRAGQNVAKANTDVKDADDSARSAASPRYGILFKGHTAKQFGFIDAGPWRHATLRAVVNWSQYVQLDALLRERFLPVRLAQLTGGDMMVTIGARAEGGTGDTSLRPDGKALVAEFNHTNDRSVHADDVVRLKTMDDAQFTSLVQALVSRGQFFIDNHNAPPNQLPYEVEPDPVGGQNCIAPGIPLFCTDDIWDGYNSNSFVSGLLGSVALPLPSVSTGRYTGWTRPVLPAKFGVGQ